MLTKRMLNKFILFISLLCFTFGNDISAQINVTINPSGDSWWQSYNNYGLPGDQSYITFDLEKRNDNNELKMKILNNFKNDLIFGESFFKRKFSNQSYLKFGRYYRDFSLYLNDELSSGSLLISQNAEPMPKIGYVSNISFKNLNFKIGLSHAVFNESEIYTKAPQLHEKFIYLNVNKNQYSYGIGLVHEAMWGGSSSELGDFPNSFNDFLKVVIAADGEKGENDAHANALGNHLGIWDFFLIKNNDTNSFKLYYQHIFEDTSGLRFANQTDGLWGIEIDNYVPLTTIVVEYLDTTKCCIDPPYVDDKYYDNYQYQTGWSYKNYTLGNPLIPRLPFESSRYLFLGIGAQMNSYKIKIKSSKDIYKKSDMNYKISFIKSFDKSSLELFLVNSINQQKQVGLMLQRNLN